MHDATSSEPDRGAAGLVRARGLEYHPSKGTVPYVMVGGFTVHAVAHLGGGRWFGMENLQESGRESALAAGLHSRRVDGKRDRLPDVRMEDDGKG